MRSIFLTIFLTIISLSAYSQQLSDEQIKNTLTKQSVSSYIESVGNCPCPYNRDKAGRLCGKRSAWSKAGGHSPLCYPSDITNKMIDKYKNYDFKQEEDDNKIEGRVFYEGTKNPGKLIQNTDQDDRGR